jgi:hypothetical protein
MKIRWVVLLFQADIGVDSGKRLNILCYDIKHILRIAIASRVMHREFDSSRGPD